MTKLPCGLAASAILAAAAVGFAGPASAEPPGGSYTAMTFEGNMTMPGKTSSWTLTPCGPDCTVLESDYAPRRLDMRPNGVTWTGTFELRDQFGVTVNCIRTFDPAAPSAVDNCSPGELFTNYRLTRNICPIPVPVPRHAWRESPNG